jgi:flagellar FliL protein
MPATLETTLSKNGSTQGGAHADPSGGPAIGASSGGGIKPWLPLLITILSMPGLAYLSATFLLIPKIQKAANAQQATSETKNAEETETKGDAKEGHTTPAAPANGRVNYPFGKVLVNVSGSLGTRYLLTSFTLAGTEASFRTRIESNRDRLVDLASSTMSTKTIVDLEKPGARNLLRAELISAFNTALGGNYVREIYFTEFAIQ